MKFLKAIAVFLWLCALALSAAVVFGTYVPRKDSTPQEPSYSNAAAGAYNGLSKLVWGIVLSWTTFACVKGFGGERIDRERPNLKSYHFLHLFGQKMCCAVFDHIKWTNNGKIRL